MRAGRSRRRALLGLALTVALVAAGCGGDGGGSTGAQSGGGGTPQLKGLITPGTLIVGTELPAPPFWIGKDYDSLTGGFDLSKEIGKRLGLNQVKYVEMPSRAWSPASSAPATSTSARSPGPTSAPGWPTSPSPTSTPTRASRPGRASR